MPLNHQKQTWGLKFDTLGGSGYTYIVNTVLYENGGIHSVRAWVNLRLIPLYL